ncbi:MAG: polyprenyl synthetase family protein [Bacteroidetes bacterium]|nr:polyprenyl synthetase family protein [Bacteroidota bacterium]
MKSIQELQIVVENELTGLSYPESPADLYAPIDYVLTLGGKRMRPILLLLAHQLFDENIAHAIKPALGIEIFHNFTLLHDDIMDDAPLRRGQQTVHEKWNPNVAILSGDTMLVQAYQMIAETPANVLKKALDVFIQTATEVCEGQQYDMYFEMRDDVAISEYIKMIEYKTAVLLAGSLKIGALTGGATEDEANHLYEFGRNIGIAFQLKDDLLDVFGDQDKFGKQVGGDILANKKTYLYLKSLSDAEGAQKENLEHWFSSKEFEATEKVRAVKSIYSELHIEEQTTAQMQAYYGVAMRHLSQISGDKRYLEQFASMLMVRES